MTVIGPGAQQEQATDVQATLDGASEFEYITILNPLTDDFAIRVAQDIPVNMPFEVIGKTSLVQSENDIVRNYGLGLKNPDFKARKHIVNDTVVKAGATINLRGNEAQVAVRQLVNEILQREGHQRLLSDPVLRQQVEERIIIKRGNVQELMDTNLQSVQAQTTAAINKSNEVSDEQPNTGATYTPALTSPAGGGSGGAEAAQPAGVGNGSPRRLGRPKKSDS